MIDPGKHERSAWPSRVPPGEDGWRFWTRCWDGPELVVFGHSVLTRPLITSNVAGIDGGAVFGLSLHALVLPDMRVVSVRGRHDHGQQSRGRTREPIRLYPVHDDVCTYS